MGRRAFVIRIADFRKQMGITQSELAGAIGVSKNTISSYETKVFCPSAYHALLLCEFFKCRFEDLFSFEDLDDENSC